MDPILTLTDRARFYRQEFPEWEASWLHATSDNRWLTGYWALGNDYRNKSRLYGAYPPGYLHRVLTLFPDATRILHVFSGALERPQEVSGLWVGLDIARDHERLTGAQGGGLVQGNAEALPFAEGSFDLVLADPPYSTEDAKRYGVPMPNRLKVTRDLHRVVEPGGALVWLDCSMPMYRNVQWRQFGGVGVQRSTNHRFRGVVMFWRA